MSSEPSVSIIVVNWNVADLLDVCLRSIEAHAPSGRHIQVLVVDNASTDNSVELVRARHQNVDLIVNTANIGFARANNLALERCGAPFIMLLNPDAELLPEALESLISALETDPGVAIAGAMLLNPDGSFQRGCGGALPTLANTAWHSFRFDRLMRRRWAPPPLFYDEHDAELRAMQWVSGAAMLVRRSALEHRIFDDRFFMYAEDMELCHRMTTEGHSIRFVPHARVKHHMGASMRRQTSQAITASLVNGPRAFFRMRHGGVSVLCFDAIVFFGYLLRWTGFAVRAVLGADANARQRAHDYRRFSMVAAKLLITRRRPSAPARTPGADPAH